MKALRPMLFLAAMLLIIGLACSAVSGGEAPSQPPAEEPVQVNPPTTEPEPITAPATEAAPATEVVVATEAPTESAPEALDFFVEEFEDDYVAENWQSFTLGDGDASNLVMELQDDHLLFDMGDENVYAYYIYAAYTYEDVSLKLNAENRGRNNNNVSLVCRMNDEGTQWYEFSVESGGVWYLYAMDDGAYKRMDNGGTNALKQGREVNEYQMDCEGDEITLYVNGTKIKTVKDTKYFFDDGFVGFNISSLNVLPITVEVNSFEIALP